MQHICVSLVPLFADLPEKDQLKINSLASHRRYQKGETGRFFSQGMKSCRSWPGET